MKSLVSMTTISSRLPHLAGVIRRILDGTVSPDRFILHISNMPAGLDEGLHFDDLPTGVKKMVSDGRIEVKNVDNIASYRKLLPVLEERLDDEWSIITADDDVAYPPNWLEGLLDAASSFTGIVAYRSRVIKIKDGNFEPYNTWKFADAGQQGANLLPTGRGGILYRPSFFQNLTLLRFLMENAPHQDDIAFRFATLASGIPTLNVDVAKSGSSKIEFDGFNYPESLYKQNVVMHGDRNLNDDAIDSIICNLDYVVRKKIMEYIVSEG